MSFSKIFTKVVLSKFEPVIIMEVSMFDVDVVGMIEVMDGINSPHGFIHDVRVPFTSSCTHTLSTHLYFAVDEFTFTVFDAVFPLVSVTVITDDPMATAVAIHVLVDDDIDTIVGLLLIHVNDGHVIITPDVSLHIAVIVHVSPGMWGAEQPDNVIGTDVVTLTVIVAVTVPIEAVIVDEPSDNDVQIPLLFINDVTDTIDGLLLVHVIAGHVITVPLESLHSAVIVQVSPIEWFAPHPVRVMDDTIVSVVSNLYPCLYRFINSSLDNDDNKLGWIILLFIVIDH